MTFEERKRVIALWLEPRSDAGFLARFKLPSLPEPAIKAELVDLVEVMAESLPILPNQEALIEFLHNLGREVSRRAKTRAWPLQAEFVAAIEAVRKRPAPKLQIAGKAESADPLLSRKVELAAEWFAKFKQLPGWWNTEAICIGLIKGGHLTYEDLKQAHANVPMRENARHLGAAPVNPKTFGGSAA